MKLKNEQIQYIEFKSNDLAKIKAFYSSAFAWEFIDYGETYTAFEGDFVDGGFELGDPIKGSVLVILYSTDLQVTKEKVLSAGGEICQDIFDFPGGKRFHFVDPDGNEVAVWSDQ